MGSGSGSWRRIGRGEGARDTSDSVDTQQTRSQVNTRIHPPTIVASVWRMRLSMRATRPSYVVTVVSVAGGRRVKEGRGETGMGTGMAMGRSSAARWRARS